MPPHAPGAHVDGMFIAATLTTTLVASLVGLLILALPVLLLGGLALTLWWAASGAVHAVAQHRHNMA